jgi:hypothetical protein
MLNCEPACGKQVLNCELALYTNGDLGILPK